MFKKDIIPHKKKKKEFSEDLIFFIKLGAFFIFIVFGFYFYNFGLQGLSQRQEVWAQFGDYFGGVLNPIFAFLAFIALLITIKLQNDALKQSKEELELTRKELEKSAKAQEEQSKSLQLQNKAVNLQLFENAFFQLIDLFNNTKQNISINPKSLTTFTSGGQLFSLNKKNYKIESTIFDTEDGLYSYQAIEKYLAILNDCYKKEYDIFNNEFESHTGTYFGQIYQVLKFIEDKDIKDKQRFINIFRAQFTKDELEFLFYHCLGEIGERKFKKLVEDYEFFEHIVLNDNIENQLLEYDIKAFGRNEKIIDKYKNLEKEKV